MYPYSISIDESPDESIEANQLSTPPRRHDDLPPWRRDDLPPRQHDGPPPRRYDGPPPRRHDDSPPRRHDGPPPRRHDDFPDGRPGRGMPPGPPPQFIPERSFGGPHLKAIDPGSIRGCLNNFAYIWLESGRSFWMYITFVGRRSVSGYRYTNFGWAYSGLDLDSIESFTCSRF